MANRLRKILLVTYKFLIIWVFNTQTAQANICGTDYQNFNTTTNGIDYITVQASETLEPCFINTGIGLNYAANSLTYSKTVGNSRAGTRAGDRLFSGDFNIGTGLTQNWDAGISMPVLFKQDIDDTKGVSYFKSHGVTEIRLNTKYKFYDDGAKGGLATIFSVNKNLIGHNPFVGDGDGPTTNFEFAFDRKFDPFTAAINFGYRHRSPGDPIPNVPFTPIQDQWIFSVAGSYYQPQLDSKFVFEIFGARPAEPTTLATNRSLTATEWIAGIKKDIDHSWAVNAGVGSKLLNSLGSPDWRIFAGMNWVFGPVCPETVKYAKVEQPKRPPIELMIVPVAIFFDFNSDRLLSKFYPEIDAFMQNLMKSGFRTLTITGHTDSLGNALYNLDLSTRRAASVSAYVMKQYGLSNKKIHHAGYGESRPIASNANYQGRLKNRRVEFFVEH